MNRLISAALIAVSAVGKAAPARQLLDREDDAAERGVELKWFGRAEPHGYTSRHNSWRYMHSQDLPETDRILSTLFDMRLPLTFTLEDCEMIGEIILDVLDA